MNDTLGVYNSTSLVEYVKYNPTGVENEATLNTYYLPTKETLQARIDTYKNNSKEILDYYRNVGLLKTVDSSAHPEEIVEQATEE